jgi:hypothetical protein
LADTLTTNYQWIMPEDQASADTWGQKLNGNFAAIDGVVWQQAQTFSAQVSPGSINWSNSAATAGQQVRWSMNLLNTEAASNVGSDLGIYRFDNTGAPFASGGSGPPIIGQPPPPRALAAGAPVMTINRATGAATFNAPASFAAGATFTGSYGLNLNGSLIQFYSTDGITRYGSINSYVSGGQNGVGIQASPAAQAVELIVGADGSGNNGIITNSGLVMVGGTGHINFMYGPTITSRISWAAANPGNPTASGTLTIANAGSTLALDNAGNFTFSGSGSAYKPGGGSWAALSDARIKTVEGDYADGLEEVLALHPVVYRYKGNDGDAHDPSQRRVGLIAQEVEPVMPGMVTTSEGTIDGKPVNDLRRLDTSELIFALVNTVKELHARIELLEAKTAAP